MGLGKVMTVTCTYDHRVIQGAESGMFLARLQALLEGTDGFYDAIFADLKIPHQARVWQADRTAIAGQVESRAFSAIISCRAGRTTRTPW